jgi:hypothetical protein
LVKAPAGTPVGRAGAAVDAPVGRPLALGADAELLAVALVVEPLPPLRDDAREPVVAPAGSLPVDFRVVEPAALGTVTVVVGAGAAPGSTGAGVVGATAAA